MNQTSVINNILVPEGMESAAESVRDEYVTYFKTQAGFISSSFYKSIDKEHDGSIKYINTVVWASYSHYEKVVNEGFSNAEGFNGDGYKVLGKGFPEPIKVSTSRYLKIARNTA